MTTEDILTVDLTINVLGYREEDEWVALALEMDLRGYGESFDAALEDLKDLVRMQISFAVQKGQPEMIQKPAEPIWYERFASLRAERLRHLAKSPSDEQSDYQIAGLAIPPADVIASLSGPFQPSSSSL